MVLPFRKQTFRFEEDLRREVSRTQYPFSVGKAKISLRYDRPPKENLLEPTGILLCVFNGVALLCSSNNPNREFKPFLSSRI